MRFAGLQLLLSEAALAWHSSTCPLCLKLAPFLLLKTQTAVLGIIFQMQQNPKEEEEGCISSLCPLLKREENFLRSSWQSSLQVSVARFHHNPMLQYSVIHSWLNLTMWNQRYGGTADTKECIYGGPTVWKVGTPHTHSPPPP